MIDRPKSPTPCTGHREGRCLMCCEIFHSDGPHNRICPKCKLSRRWREREPAERGWPDRRH